MGHTGGRSACGQGVCNNGDDAAFAHVGVATLAAVVPHWCVFELGKPELRCSLKIPSSPLAHCIGP